MMDKLGILVVEESDGKIGIQLFAEPEKAKSSFEQLARGTFERVTFLDLDFTGELKVVGMTKKPDEIKAPEHAGWRIGQGPIDTPKEEKKD